MRFCDNTSHGLKMTTKQFNCPSDTLHIGEPYPKSLIVEVDESSTVNILEFKLLNIVVHVNSSHPLYHVFVCPVSYCLKVGIVVKIL